MAVPELGVLEQVPIRDIWRHEANDLTPWLAEHPDLVAEALGGLEDMEPDTEVSVGAYKADLVLRGDGATIVVENMYGSTNHDHVGKLITYAAGLDASHAVLVAEEFRPEHRSALNWLNSVSTEDRSFFGLVLEAWRIGGSPPAPRVRVEVQPDNWSRSVRASSTAHATERTALYLKFWAAAMEGLHQRGEAWRRKRKPQRASWMEFRNDFSDHGVGYNGAFGPRDGNPGLRAEAYLSAGDYGELTSDLYRMLESRREKIEADFGAELDWQPLETKKASRIAAHFSEPLSIVDADDDQLARARDWLVDALVRLRTAMHPALEELWAMEEWPD